MIRRTFIFYFWLTGLVASAQDVFQKEVYYDPDSVHLKEVIHFSKADSTLQGSYESFHLNGSLKTLGYYKNNLPDSIWTYYYENGRKKAVGEFEKERATGNWTYFYENGNKKSEGRLKAGTRHGLWNFYYENGDLKSSGSYFRDIKKGLWDYYYENEILKAQAYYEEGKGIYKEFYPSGDLKMEGQNKDEKSIGEWKYYYQTGELQAKGTFKNGLRVGEWKYYHKNGHLAAIGDFSEGKKEGIWRQFHEDGAIKSEGAMEDGEKDGFWKLYYPTGEVKGEAEYQEGTGKYLEYYPSGQLRVEGMTKDGKKHGVWTYYSETGLVDGEANYEEGVGEYTGYYADGKVKMKGRIEGEKRVGEWKLYNEKGDVVGTYKPIYEDERPIFKSRQSSSLKDPSGSEKPEYLYESKKLRYFMPVVNEYEGVIIGGNPAAVFLGHLPVALEYYKQERLGYELQFILRRDPFFISDENISLFTHYTRGGTLQLRQKFYHADRKYGMWYFGHQIAYSSLVHSVKVLDDTFEEISGQTTEEQIYYGVFVGSRWLQRTADSGLTVDAYMGLGMGLRNYNKNYRDNEQLDDSFDSIIKKRGFFPVLMGLNIGFVGPKRRQTK